MRTSTIVAILLVAAVGIWAIATYNRLLMLDRAAEGEWAQVESVYRRRVELVPDLVETMRREAAFEKGAYDDVTAARTRAGQAAGARGITRSATTFARFQDAQVELSSALGRLLSLAARYPRLAATPTFRDRRSLLEETERRIADERRRYNEAAQAFNARRRRFPALLVARVAGLREKQTFQPTR